MTASRFWACLLVDDYFFLSLGLAGAFLVALHYLVSAGWWAVLRRVPEALMSWLPFAALLTLPLYFGRRELYPWARPEVVLREPLVAAKSAYLNTPSFFGRMLAFLLLWSLFAWLFRRTSLAQDREDGGLAGHRKMVRLSAFFVVTFAVTFSLASFDWLMSLDPRWFSTIFAVYCFAGLLQSGIAAVALAVVVLGRRGPLAGKVTAGHRHDLGKLLFGFSTFWAYIWVSQYLLIWYSNLPEEVTFYTVRTGPGWAPLFFLTLALGWVVPFLLLLSRGAKRSPAVLAVAAGVVLVGHWLDLFVLVAPPVVTRVALGWPELVLTALFAALFLAVVGRSFRTAAPVALHDPFLAESLHHHG